MAEQVVATIVAPGTVIRGELRCAGDLVVHGRIEGAVICGGALTLEPGGTIEAEIRARSAVLAGRVRGDVSVVEGAELAPSCRMMGDLRAARVAIAPGAAVRGRVELGDVGSDDDGGWDADAPESTPEPAEVAVPAEAVPAIVAAPAPELVAVAEEIAAAAAEPTPVVEPSAAPTPEVAAAQPEAPRRPPPPPPPPSALALGVRSTISIKR